MAFSTTSIHPVAKPAAEPSTLNHTDTASLLSMIVLSVYAAQKSQKQFRKLKRNFLWTAFKLKLKSLFARPAARVSDRVLIYILLGVLFLALLIVDPIIALALAVLVLILILAGVI
jgi:hypothetical protein